MLFMYLIILYFDMWLVVKIKDDARTVYMYQYSWNWRKFKNVSLYVIFHDYTL